MDYYYYVEEDLHVISELLGNFFAAALQNIYSDAKEYDEAQSTD
jgi:hypothetical protein